ncbi:ABC transporter ATP-binding protein [Maricaulis sp.]|uniref:ABC transporter ATP-binding protein n=1 Tax=Maricaulis sp. TaxID=1486257 RepID=UPI002B269AFC|nr:ABC transporter ATP-binding protein [Maricaulis sp.]
MADTRTVLSIRGAERRYRADHAALAGADLDLHAGRITALLGPSGSGKSTLLRAIAGLERLEAGSICLGGTCWNDTATHVAPEARRVGMVFQDYALFPHMTALANVAFGLTGPDKTTRAQAQLEAAELGHRAKAYPHELSGGEQQRVALARALAPQPSVVLLDEPFSGLDRRLRAELRERTIDTLRTAGTTALIVTHDAEEAMAVADQLALMDGGRIIQTGPPDDVWMSPVSATAARLLGDVEIIESQVTDGQAKTPFGPVDANGFDDGQPVSVLIRPRAFTLSLDPDGPCTITRRRSAGPHLTHRFASEIGEWTAQTPAPSPIREGDRVSVELDPAYVRVVAA